MAKRKIKKQEKKQNIYQKLTGTLSAVAGSVVVAKLVAIILIIVLLISFLSGIICVIFAIFQVVENIITTLTGLDTDLLGGNRAPVSAGSRYEWNVQDLEKMPDEWSKNLYRLAWLGDANKSKQNSDMPMNLLLGIPVLEVGSLFFPNTDDHGLGYADGTGQNWNNYSIAEYATVGGAFPYSTAYDYITGLYANDASYLAQNFSVAENATWGDIPHTTLKTDTIGARHEQYINTYAKGDVDKSVYSATVSVARTISLYDTAKNGVLTQDADYGYSHKYKKYFEQACERYGLDATNSQLQSQIYSMLYYLVHAGGVWEHKDIADDFNYVALDYVTYVYSVVADGDLSNIRIADNYTSGSAIRTLGSDTLKAAVRGNANVNHANASFWCEPNISATYLVKVIDDDGNTVNIDNSLVGMWMDNNTATGHTDLNDGYIRVYEHSNVSLVRQGGYAFSTGCTAIFAGNARLDYIFDILDIDYVVDPRTGYVCYQNGAGESGSVPEGHYSGTFDTENSNIQGYSNYRDDSWFADIDNSEWSNPLNPDLNGGFKITSRYGYRYLDKNNPWDWHSGIDLAYKVSSTNLAILRSNYPVYAMHDGEIVYANTTSANSGGRYLHYKVSYMRNGKQVTRYLTYMHLSGFTPEVEQALAMQLGNNVRGTVSIPVSRGTPIAYMGGSGTPSGTAAEFGYAVHLHISLSTNPIVAGNPGRIDIETELPFVTMYDGYDSWFGVDSGLSGYLSQKPAGDLSPNTSEPQSN